MSDFDFTEIQRVGPVNEGDGNGAPFRAGKQRETIVGVAHGRFHESASRGTLFWASTAAAGVAPGTAFSTTPPMALWNPPNSGVLASVQQVWMAYVSGTMGAGCMGHGLTLGQVAAPTTGTELVPQSGLLSGVRGRVRAFQGSTLVAAPTILRPSTCMGPFLATTVVQFYQSYDEVDGSIVVPPGAVYTFQGAALGAGTTPLVIIGVSYEEVPIA